MHKNNLNLKGQLLIAMPNIGDQRFNESVIFICDHTSDGAMGLVINLVQENMDFNNILQDLDIPKITSNSIDIQSGGPVDSTRGFIIHSNDYYIESTIFVTKDILVTASIDIIKDIANNSGPNKIKFTLGYTGWAAGQLEEEMQQNIWLNTSAKESLVFSTDLKNIWRESVGALGINISYFSSTPGHA